MDDPTEDDALSTGALAAATADAAPAPARNLPPVLGRLLRGTFWMALRTPLQAVFALWTVPLIIDTVGEASYGAFGFAWGFGFLQFLLEFGMSSALNRQVAEAWARDDRPAVEKAVACGMNFYAAAAAIQAVVLVAIAAFGIPAKFGDDSHRLIVKLLMLQALTSPVYGLSTVVFSVLQAARRYDFMPRLDLIIVIARFAILAVGLKLGVDFFLVVAAQIVVQVGLGLGPALWVLTREMGIVPRPSRSVRLADYGGLIQVSVFMFLMQLSVVLGDRLDTTVLGYALDEPEGAISIYQTISKPFLQIRQTGWQLAYFVMPAVASLAVAGDLAALEKIKYDGTRLLIALLLPVTLLAGLYARPFLDLWVPRYAGDAPLMQLFLVAALPLALSILVQASIGMGKVKVVALAALAGSLVNLPLSFVLTRWLGVSGVIWGTVLTTLISNGLLPGIYVFKTLDVHVGRFFRQTLAPPLAGAAALLAATWAFGLVMSADSTASSRLVKALPFVAHLIVGCVAYGLAYALTASGRADVLAMARRLGLVHGGPVAID